MKYLNSIPHSPGRSLRQRLWPATSKTESVTDWNPRPMLIGLMVPFMMVILNMTMFGVALPTVRSTFNIQADTTAWLVTAYMLPFMIFMPLYGRLGDGLGKRRLFLIGVAIFLVGTAITLSAANLRLLFFGRVIQGLGAGAVSPLCLALISEYFPANERGKALGTWNSVGPATAIAGPFLAGFLVDYLGWRVIFGPIFLVGLLALLAVKTQVPPTGRKFVQSGFLQTFDWGGVVLLGVAITVLIFFVSSRPITGVESLRDWRLLILTVLLFGSFIFWEKRQANPFVPFEIFASKNFNRAAMGAGIRMFVMSGTGVFMPLYLADVRELEATSIGLMLMLYAGSLLVTMRIGGQLADRWGSRWLVVGGALVQAGAMVSLGLLPGSVGLGFVVGGLVIHGLGAGVYLAALHRSAMSRIDQGQMGVAAGLYSMVRFGGRTLGAALGGVVLQQGLDRSLPPVEAYQVVFWCMAGVALLGVVVGWGLRE